MQEASGKSTTPNATRTISCIAWNSPGEYQSWVARCDIKGSVSTLLNPIFSKKVQGQKHPGRRGIVEHKIPSIKVLFKTNTKCHTHPSIRLLSKSKTQLVNQRNQKVAFICAIDSSNVNSPQLACCLECLTLIDNAMRGTGCIFIILSATARTCHPANVLTTPAAAITKKQGVDWSPFKADKEGLFDCH